MAHSTTAREGAGLFPATQWTVILAAGATPSPESAAALEHLGRAYWYPLYAFVRRRGHSPPEAQDLTQEFFARLLEHNWVAQVDREKGRFRSFLLMAMKRFLAKEWGKATTIKRGRKVRLVPFPVDPSETRYALEPADTRTPEQVFEMQWALTLLESVLCRLRQDFVQEGKGELFQTLEPCLIGNRESLPYVELGAKLGISEAAIKMAVLRLRERYRALLKEQIRQTVASRAEVDEELRHLFRVLSRG